MARVLKKANAVVLGNGTAVGTTATLFDGRTATGITENTIQSFNGDLFKYNQSFFINVVHNDVTLVYSGVTSTSVTSSTEFTHLSIATASLNSLNLEPGDVVLLLHDAAHPGDDYEAVVVGVNYTTGVLTLRLRNPHATTSGTLTSDVSSTALLRNGESGGRFYFRIPVGDDFASAGRTIGTNSIVDLDFGSLDFVNAGTINTTEFPGLERVIYHHGTTTSARYMELAFDTAANRNSALAEANDERPETVSLEYSIVAETFTDLRFTKPVLVGSKNTNTSTFILPITLPSGTIIEAGDGIEDLFLINMAGA